MCQHSVVRAEGSTRSFGHGPPLAVLVLAFSLVAGCGSAGSTKPAARPVDRIYTYLRGVVTRAGIGDPDLKPAISAGCTAYADDLRTRGGDSATFDQYIADLFDTNAGGLDQARVDRAVTDACTSFHGDVARFVDDLSSSLGLTLDQLQGYVATACAGFEQRRRVNTTDPYAPEAFDPLVASVFAKSDLDRTAMGKLVDAVCGDAPQPGPTVPASSPTTPTLPR